MKRETDFKRKTALAICRAVDKTFPIIAVISGSCVKRIFVMLFILVLVLSSASFASAQVYYQLSGVSNAVTVIDGDPVEYGYEDDATPDVIIPVTWVDSVGAKFYVDEHYPDGSVFRRSALYGVQQVGTTSRNGSFVFTKGSIKLPYRSETPVYDFYHETPAAPVEPSNTFEDGSTKEPIDTKNGNNYFTEQRIFVPCPGVSLKLDLNYQSVSEAPIGILGKGWRHSLEWHLDIQTDQAALYTDTGRKSVFRNDGTGGYLSPFGKNWTLEETATGYAIGMPGGLYYDFEPNGVLSTIHDAWGNAVECSYGTNGCLETATHSNGRELLFSNEWHAASGQWRTTSISVKDGISLAFDYNGEGQFTQVVEQVGMNCHTSFYQYAGSILTNRIDGAGFEYSYGYAIGTNGLLNGKGTHLDVDGYYAHEVEYLLPDLTEVRYSRHGADQIYRYFRNRDGLLKTKYGPGESVSNAVICGVHYSYSANNEDRTEETLFNNVTGATWSKWMLHDKAHNITKISVGYDTTHPVHQFSIHYDPAWQLPASFVDATGNRAEIVYTNALPLAVKVYYSDSNSYDTCFSYTTNGLLQSLTNANGHVTIFDYDHSGNLTGITAACGPVISNTYNALGFLESSEILTEDNLSVDRTTRYETDAGGRVLQVTYPDGHAAFFAYNTLGYLTNMIDRAGRGTDYTYAPTKKLTSVTRYLNTNGSNVPIRVDYDLDTQANLLRIREPCGRYVESCELDIQDRVTSITNIDGQVMNIDYTIGDFVDQITRFDRSTIEYSYDDAGRKSAMLYMAESRTNAALDFNYFANSQLESISDGFSVISNSFDRINRLTNMISISENTRFDVQYAYDPIGNVTNTTVCFNNPIITNLTTDLTYDAVERLTNISCSGAAPQRFVYSYSPINGRIESVSNAVTGITTSYRYNQLDRVTNITYRTGDGTMIHTFDYHYNTAGMIERKSSGDGTGFTMTEYTYDSLDRLVCESSTANGLPVSSKSYSYDHAGNRLSKAANGLTTTYSLGNGNRLDGSSTTAKGSTLFICGTANEPIGTDDRWGELWITNFTIGTGKVPSINDNTFFAEIPAVAGRTNTIHAAICDRAGNTGYATADIFVPSFAGTGSTAHYSHNAAGCMTNIVEGTSSTALDWDERYRLINVSAQDSVVSYGYDVLGRRVSRIETSNSNPQITNCTYYVYDGYHVVADLDIGGHLLRTYVWGPGVDNLLALSDHISNHTYYPIKDHQNSVIALTDAAGHIVEAYEYDAYGNILSVKDGSGNLIDNRQSAVGNRYTFQGRETDWDTGLYYYRARWYDPEAGRWLSKDPIGISGGFNLYEFCKSNPVNVIDPDGRDVVYLDDSAAVRGAGHAASAVGNDRSGWTYYSFGMGDDRGGPQHFGTSDNMTIRHYRTYEELRKDNPRYDKQICYKTSQKADMDAHREAISHINDRYWLFGHNCDDVAASILRAAGIDFKDYFRPNTSWVKNVLNNEGLTK